MGSTSESVRIERSYHAQPDEVFRAWVEPERFQRWFQPLPGFMPCGARGEARAGGEWAVELVSERDERVTFGGRYREIRAPERLVFELGRSGNGAPRSLVTVRLSPASEGTHLELLQEGVAGGERAEVEQAWQRCLARMGSVFERALERFFARLECFPRFRSRFGGLWPDLSDASARIAGKQALGLLDAGDAARFRHWVEKGYVVLPGAVRPELVARLRAELERDWQQGNERVAIEICLPDRREFARMEPRYRDVPHKLLDYHGVSHTAREVLFAPAIRRFLEQLFERPPLAFQSLIFRWGTEQEMHQDTAYVLVRSPLEFVGCWIALEDVEEGSGELQYYEGSQRIPEYLWFGRSRAKPYDYGDERDFLRWVCEQSERADCPLVRFRPKAGDALLWHADLVHGGAKRSQRAATRWSLVAHFSPLDVEPEWFDTAPNSGRMEHAPGCHYCYIGR
jgi:uncharacterized protein YndB with AHSA1/START domain